MSKAPTFDDLVPSAPKGRFDGIKRSYTAEDVVRLRGNVQVAIPSRNLAPPGCGDSSMAAMSSARSAP